MISRSKDEEGRCCILSSFDICNAAYALFYLGGYLDWSVEVDENIILGLLNCSV